MKEDYYLLAVAALENMRMLVSTRIAKWMQEQEEFTRAMLLYLARYS